MTTSIASASRSAPARSSVVRARVAACGGLDVLRATRSTHFFPPHLHDAWAITIVEGGAGRLWHRRASRIVALNEIFVVAPYEVHAEASADAAGWSYAALHPGDDVMRAAAVSRGCRFGERLRFAPSVFVDPRLAARLARLIAQLAASPASLALSAHVMELLGDLIERHAMPMAGVPAPAREHRAVMAARTYIETNYAQPIRLATLARQVNLSVFHLIRLFRRATGLPPCGYLEQVRVLRAQTMLLAGASLSEVAYATGFSDQSHFTRRFKRVFGVTPGQYARDSRRGEVDLRPDRRSMLSRRGA